MFPDPCIYLEYRDGTPWCKWWDVPTGIGRCDRCGMFEPADAVIPDDDRTEELDFGD